MSAPSGIKIVPGDSDAVATFIFYGEDHTLGNALRQVLMRMPSVAFCGYTIPHPSEDEMNMRLQTTGAPAVEVLDEGLRQLAEGCDVLDQAFDEAMEAAKAGGRATVSDPEPPVDWNVTEA
jgi:DNA-directed RNA polymerase I and III subunit RPAC2